MTDSSPILSIHIRPPSLLDKKMAFAHVVRTTMAKYLLNYNHKLMERWLMKHWVSLIRDHQRDVRDLISDVNVSLVFDPPAITAQLIESRTDSRIGSRNGSLKGSVTELRSLAVTPNGSLPLPLPMEQTSTQPNTASTTPMAELEAHVQQLPTSESVHTSESTQEEAETASEPIVQEPFPVAIDLDALEELNQTPPESIGKKIVQLLKSFAKWLRNIPFFAIDPTKSFYYYWSFLIYIGVLYNCAMCVIFAFDDPSVDFYKYWFMGNVLFDFIFAMDIFFNSKLTYMEEGSTVTEWKKLLKHYTHSKEFLFDIFAILPTDLFLLLHNRLCLVRVTRIVKVYRVRDFLDYANMRTNFPNVLKIMNIAVLCLVLFHWNAALYYMISLWTGIETENWANDWTGWPWQFTYKKNPSPIFVPCLMDRVFNHSLQCQLFDENPEKYRQWNYLQGNWTNTTFDIPYYDDASPQEDYRSNYTNELLEFWSKEQTYVFPASNFSKQYILSLYWSSLTMTTRGQQPFPTHNSHNSLEIFDTIIGMIVFAVIVSGAENVISSMNKDRSEMQGLLDGLKFYMNYRNVSESMQKRVIEFIMYTQKYGSTKNEEEIMTSMPPRLRGELAVHLHMENLQRVELLKNCEPNLLYELVLRLQMHVFSPNDYLCRVGDVAKEMFIVKSGVLEVLSDEGKVFSILREGNTFGELSILKLGSGQRGGRHKRMRALRSVGYSDVYILRQEDALEVLHDYPAVRAQLIEKAQEMLRQRNHDLADQEGLDEVHQIEDAQTIEDTLSSIAKVIQACERDIDKLYENFHTTSADYKKRVTHLEMVYKDNRRTIKKDIIEGRLVL